MQHYIIVKWKADQDKEKLNAGAVKAFENITSISGCNNVTVHNCCIDRSNRYDVMIIIDIDKEALSNYDNSEIHHKWKEDFEPFMEKKAIFDHE